MTRVSTAASREHVLALLASGMGTRSVAEVAQITRGTVQWVLKKEAMTSGTEAAILAVPLTLSGPKNIVDATGTHRRIQALTALGWSSRQQADLVGRKDHPYRSSLARDKVMRDTAAEVWVVYDKLSMQVPTGRNANWVKAHARKSRWFPPLAWDDETLDDPATLPCLLPPVRPCDPAVELVVQHAVAGHDVVVTAEARREIVLRTLDRPMNWTAKVAQCSYELVRRIRMQAEVAA